MYYIIVIKLKILEYLYSNVIARVSLHKANPWKFHFYFNEIWELSSSINVGFRREVRSANCMVDALAKHGVESVSSLSVGVIM